MDMYHIPSDDQKNWREHKFIQYVMGSTTGADTWLLRSLADIHKLDLDERIWLCWLHTCCNCESTAWLLYQLLDYRFIKKSEVSALWDSDRNKLVFVTDRIYVKSNNEFVNLIGKFVKHTHRQPQNLLHEFDTFSDLYNELCTWRYMGRYSTELFLEAIVTVTGQDIQPDTQDFDFDQGRTMTSGLLNTLYLDDIANAFDNGVPLDQDTKEKLTKYLPLLHKRFMKTSGLNVTLSQLTPKLCSWRKLFKGQRYGTYYIDRQLKCLTQLESYYPNRKQVWDQIYEARRALFDPSVLGELYGRKGIQSGKNKLFLQTGFTGFEKVEKPLWNTKLLHI